MYYYTKFLCHVVSKKIGCDRWTHEWSYKDSVFYVLSTDPKNKKEDFHFSSIKVLDKF